MSCTRNTDLTEVVALVGGFFLWAHYFSETKQSVMSGQAQQSGSCIIFSALTDCFVTYEWPVCRYREGPALPIRCTFQGTLRDLVTSLKPRQPRKIYYQQVMAIMDDLVLLRVHDQLTLEGRVKGCQFDDFRFTVDALYMCEPLYGYCVFVNIGASVLDKGAQVKILCCCVKPWASLLILHCSSLLSCMNE